MSSKWQRGVLKGGATFVDKTYPFVLRLLAGESIGGLIEYARAFHLLVVVCDRTEWRDNSIALVAAARSDPLYQVVLQGLQTKGRRSAQCALRRYEAIRAWRQQLFDTLPPDEAEAAVQRQIAYGVSRNKLRVPRKTPPAKHAAPIARLKNMDDPTAYETVDMSSAVWAGSQRTTRVFDEVGNEAWILPRSTLVALPALYKLDPPAVEEVPNDEALPPEPELPGPEATETLDIPDEYWGDL